MATASALRYYLCHHCLFSSLFVSVRLFLWGCFGCNNCLEGDEGGIYMNKKEIERHCIGWD